MPVVLDNLIKSVTSYTTRPWYLILGIFPLFCLGVFLCGFSFFLQSVLEYNFSLSIVCLDIWLYLLIFQMLLLYFTILDVHIGLLLTSKKVDEPSKALFVKVTLTPNQGGKSELAVLNYPEGRNKDQVDRFIIYGRTYTWHPEKKIFINVEYPTSYTYGEYLRSKGLNEEIVHDTRIKYPSNDLFADIPCMKILIEDHFSTSKFAFEALCFISLFYNGCIATALIASFVVFIWERRYMKDRLEKIMEFKRNKDVPHTMMVYRNKDWVDIKKEELLPGDLVSIGPSPHPLSCDLLLLRGSCVVEESLSHALGETPFTQQKESIESRNSDEKLDLKNDGIMHILYGGSKIIHHTPSENDWDGIKTEGGQCLAFVLRTGPASRLDKQWRKVRYLPKSGMSIVDILRDFNRGLSKYDFQIEA